MAFLQSNTSVWYGKTKSSQHDQSLEWVGLSVLASGICPLFKRLCGSLIHRNNILRIAAESPLFMQIRT